jgi:hypothetical protein
MFVDKEGGVRVMGCDKLFRLTFEEERHASVERGFRPEIALSADLMYGIP